MFVELQSAVSTRLQNTSWTGSPSIYIEVPVNPNHPYVTIDDISKDTTYTDDSEIISATVVFGIWYQWNLHREQVNDRELKQHIADLEDSFDQPLSVQNYEVTEYANRESAGVIDQINREDGIHRKKGIVTYDYTLVG